MRPTSRPASPPAATRASAVAPMTFTRVSRYSQVPVPKAETFMSFSNASPNAMSNPPDDGGGFVSMRTPP